MSDLRETEHGRMIREQEEAGEECLQYTIDALVAKLTKLCTENDELRAECNNLRVSLKNLLSDTSLKSFASRETARAERNGERASNMEVALMEANRRERSMAATVSKMEMVQKELRAALLKILDMADELGKIWEVADEALKKVKGK